MVEAGWLNCDEPVMLLCGMRRRINSRKLRLFACACCRRIWDSLPSQRSRAVVETAERFADGLVRRTELNAARAGAPARGDDRVTENAAKAAAETARASAFDAAVGTVRLAVRAEVNLTHDGGKQHAVLLRHILGNPFRPVVAPASWPGTITALARAMYAGEDCHFALHDALLESAHSEFAEHFRETSQPKGCWVLDLILGKS